MQIKAVVISQDLEVKAEAHVHFDSMLPEYRWEDTTVHLVPTACMGGDSGVLSFSWFLCAVPYLEMRIFMLLFVVRDVRLCYDVICLVVVNVTECLR
jgi:hypothetical protein